jgi:hypothetical protein
VISRLLESGRNGAEGVLQIGAEALDDGDDRNRDPAAMRPYSMAVAAVSSLKKESVRFFMANSCWFRTGTCDSLHSYRMIHY